MEINLRLNKTPNPERNCPPSCRATEYKATVLRTSLGNGFTVIDLSYTSTSVLAKSEFYIYNLSSIIGTIGGSLGMFLGFSLYHTGKDLIGKIQRRINNKKKVQDSRTDSGTVVFVKEAIKQDVF